MKTIFYCKHCNENKYGSVFQDNLMFDQKSRVRVIQCGSCSKWTNETTEVIPNIYNPIYNKPSELSITDGPE